MTTPDVGALTARMIAWAETLTAACQPQAASLAIEAATALQAESARADRSEAREEKAERIVNQLCDERGELQKSLTAAEARADREKARADEAREELHDERLYSRGTIKQYAEAMALLGCEDDDNPVTVAQERADELKALGEELEIAEAALTACRAEMGGALTEIERIRSDREYVIGWNDGFEHAGTMPATLQFPVMLRKMWSGGDVQKWIDDALSSFRIRAALQPTEPDISRTGEP